MLPDRILDEIAENVRLWFNDNDPRLIEAAQTLADAGWVWDQISSLLSDVYDAGRNDAREAASYAPVDYPNCN